MKLFFDFLPVVLFFIAYKLAGIYVATAVAMAAAVGQAGWLWFRHRRIEPSQLLVLALIVGLGALTLAFDNPEFIKWKPTLVNWLFGLVLAGGLLIGKRNFLQRMLGQQLELPTQVWHRLNLGWAGFFLAMGALNLAVAYGYDEATWVNFKLFGLTGLTLAFGVLQAFYIARYLPEQVSSSSDKEQ
jgi:intracellular septation protein